MLKTRKIHFKLLENTAWKKSTRKQKRLLLFAAIKHEAQAATGTEAYAGYSSY
jgi:hypothetical protein